jgi:hypothetical protein
MITGTGTSGVCPANQVIIGFNTGTTIDYGKPICRTVSAFWQNTGTTLYYNSGSVGIGTSTPSTLFEVFGTGTFYGISLPT